VDELVRRAKHRADRAFEPNAGLRNGFSLIVATLHRHRPLYRGTHFAGRRNPTRHPLSAALPKRCSSRITFSGLPSLVKVTVPIALNAPIA
jgi:hypothetical protein